jgi:hypothetical protein
MRSTFTNSKHTRSYEKAPGEEHPSMRNFLEIDLNHPAHYITFGPFSVSAGNLLIIIAMMVIFTLALFMPFPNHEDHPVKSLKK